VELLTIKRLLETGVHFGHRVRKWNPKMKPFIFTERKGIHIIDLEKTIEYFTEAYEFIKEQVMQGKEPLFVGTKRQVRETIEEEAARCEAHYINRRWLGGTLTNFKTIKSRVKRMKELERMEEEGQFEFLPKKEAFSLRRKLMKLQRNLEGLRNMEHLPGLLYVIDPTVEQNAIHEARLLGIPIVAVVDTNCDPDLVDYPIPGNDDAIKATKLITSRVADAVLEGREGVSAAKAAEAEVEIETAAKEEAPVLEEESLVPSPSPRVEEEAKADTLTNDTGTRA